MVAPGQELIQRLIEQASDVRNLLKDEIAIAAINRVELNVRIEDPNLPAFANELLEQRHDWTLAQIVRILLERESDHTKTPRGHIKDCIYCAL